MANENRRVSTELGCLDAGFKNRVGRWYPGENCRFTPMLSLDGFVNGDQDFLVPYLNDFEDRELTALHGRYGMLLRGCMIACDHLASAGRTRIYRALDDLEWTSPQTN